MNLLLLVEGSESEPRIYDAWLRHLFPELRRVETCSLLTDSTFCIVAGHGYPHVLNHVTQALDEIGRSGRVDHFLICVDSDFRSLEATREALLACLPASGPRVPTHIVVQRRCIETWLLGHQALVAAASGPEARRFRERYDVAVYDPELLECPERPRRVSQHHKAYLRAVLPGYHEAEPGPALSADYFHALIERHNTTGHLATFGHLLAIWRQLACHPLSAEE